MSEKIGRTELAAALAEKHGLTKAKAAEVILTLIDEIQNNLKKGNTVTLIGFGTFEARERAARTGRNPKTGATLEIKASVTPGFKAGAGFKAALAKQ